MEENWQEQLKSRENRVTQEHMFYQHQNKSKQEQRQWPHQQKYHQHQQHLFTHCPKCVSLNEDNNENDKTVSNSDCDCICHDIKLENEIMNLIIKSAHLQQIIKVFTLGL